MNSFDVAIAGAGPAGSLLAAKLGKRGLRVVLLEAGTGTKRKVCGEYLCPKGVELLVSGDFGRVLDGRVMRGMKLFSPSGQSVDSRFPHGSIGLATRRDILDPALLDCALGVGVKVRLGTRLEAFSHSGGLWKIQAAGESFSARMLVGADGRQSLVARKLGVTEPVSHKRVALHFFAATASETPDYGEMHVLRDGSYVGISPTGKRELNVSVVCGAETAKCGGREAAERILSLSALLKSRFLPLDSDVRVSYPISHRVRSVAGPGWALVGDAAGFLDPLTGEGIYQALRSSTLLDQCLWPAFTSERKSLSGALANYVLEHKRAFAAKSRMNRLFQTLIRYPVACNWVGGALQGNPARANAFIGIVGNVYSPGEGIQRWLWERS